MGRGVAPLLLIDRDSCLACLPAGAIYATYQGAPALISRHPIHGLYLSHSFSLPECVDGVVALCILIRILIHILIRMLT